MDLSFWWFPSREFESAIFYIQAKTVYKKYILAAVLGKSFELESFLRIFGKELNTSCQWKDVWEAIKQSFPFSTVSLTWLTGYRCQCFAFGVT